MYDFLSLDSNPLFDKWFANIPFHRFPFPFVPCALQKLYNLTWCHWFLLLVLLVHIQKKMLPRPMTGSFPPMFSSRNFMVSSFMLRSLIHCWLVFELGMMEVQFHAYHYPFSYHDLLKRDPFPTEYFWLPCQLFVDYICEGLFLVSVFCSIVICMFLVLVPCCFDYYSFVRHFGTKRVMCRALFFLFKIALTIQHLLCFHLRFRAGSFHGSPVVKTLSFQCRRHEFVPCLGN